MNLETVDLETVELLHVQLPLVRPFMSSGDHRTTKDVLLVRVRASDGVEGWGECAAEVAPTYAAEFLGGAWLALRDHVVPRARAGHDVASLRGNRMAIAALEMAWLDICGRRAGHSVAALLGGRPGAAIEVGVVVEMHDDVAQVAAAAAAHVAEGYRRVKVKIAPGHDRNLLDAVRGAIGPDIALWADANGSYQPEDHEHVAALPVDLLEQPFAAGDVVDHARFRRAHPTVRVSLDESIASIHDARAALALEAADSLIIKPGRVGGLRAAVAVHDTCVAADHGVWCGGMRETGIGRAANLAVASLPGFVLPGDLSASNRYFRDDVTEPFVLGADGTLRVPDGPGLGVTVDVPFVHAHCVRREVLEAG